MKPWHRESFRNWLGRLLLVAGLLGTSWHSTQPQSFAQEQTDNEAARKQFAAAAALQNREQFELAADEWQKFLKDFAKDVLAPRARHYLGLCQLKAKQYPAAAKTFEALVAEAPKNDQLEPTYYYLGLSQYNLGQAGDAKQYVAAAASLAQTVQKFPQGKFVAQATFYQAESIYAQGKKPEAIVAYQKLVTQFPKDPLVADALYAMGVTHEELNQPQLAGPVYDKFLAQFPENALANEVLMRRGDTLFAEGKLDEAEKRFASAARVAGFALADYATLRQAACRYQRKEYAAAAELYATIPKAFPQSKYNDSALLSAGKCAYLAGDFARARSHLSGVKDQTSDVAAESGHWMVRSLLKEKQAPEALKLADALLAKHPKSTWLAQLALDRADVLFEIPARQKESVVAFADVATKYATADIAPQALYLASFSALNTGDLAAAQKYGDEFLKKYPKHELGVDVGFVAAESDLQRGQYDTAEKRYAALIAAAPQHAEANLWKLRRGFSAFLKKDYSATIALLKPLAATLPSPAMQAEANYLLGASQYELKQFKESVASLAASLKADPRWRQADEAQLMLAQALVGDGQGAVARTQLETLLKDFPQSAARDRAQYRLAELTFAAGEYPKAAVEYRKVVDQFAQSKLAPHALYGLAWSQFRGNDPQGALKPLDDLLRQHATHEVAGQAQYLRALVQQELKQPEKAIADLDAYLKTKPKGLELSNARYAMGLAQATAKQYDASIKTFRQLLSDDAKYADADKAMYELAWAFKGAAKEDEAAEAFANLAKQYEKSSLAAEALYHVGDRRYEQKNWKEASKAYYEAMSRGGQSALAEKAAHKLGWTYFQQNEFTDAEQTFVYQINTWPKGELTADGRFMAAESLFKLKKFAEALAAFQKLNEVPRKDLAVLALLHAAQSASALQNWQQTQSLAERAQAADPATPHLAEILYERAWAAQNQGRADEAMKLYEEVTGKSDAEVAARARFMIGELFFERKDHKEAIRNFFKVAYVYNYPEWQAAAQFEAARCFEVLKDAVQAKKSYQEVVDKYPQSDRAEPARKRLAALAAGK